LKVLVKEKIADTGVALLRERFDVDVLTDMTQDELPDAIGGYDAIVIRSATKLTADVIGRVQLVGTDGPKPLPSMTAVRVVGCLTSGPNDTLMLTQASEPVRSRSLNETTPEELQRSAAWPLGAQKFRLQNVPGPAVTKGHKVQAKGVLIRQYMNDRINVTSLETVASTCQ